MHTYIYIYLYIYTPKPVKLHSGDTLFVPNDGRPSNAHSWKV